MNRFAIDRRILLPALALLVCTLCMPGAVQADFSHKESFDAGELRINNLIGEIRVEGHGGGSFEVEVNVRGRDASPERMEIRADKGARATLSVVFPLNEERNYVYPKLGSRSKTSFTVEKGDSWIASLFGGLTGRRITVRGSGSGLEIWADVTVHVPQGATLHVKHGVGQVDASDVSGDLTLDTSSGRITARGIDGDLLADTGSGNVTVENVRGDVVVDTGSGSVEVTRASGSSLSVDTGSGSVEVGEIDTRSLSVDTGSGSVKAFAIRTDDANIDTGSGSVTLELDRMGDGDFIIDTGSGRISLSLPPGASADVVAETGSGGIDLDLDEGVKLTRRDDDEIAFVIGDGGARIRLDTGSGGIRISRSR
jgi:hypothetical protein